MSQEMHTYWTQNFNLFLFIEFPTRSARDTWSSVRKIPWYEAATQGALTMETTGTAPVK